MPAGPCFEIGKGDAPRDRDEQGVFSQYAPDFPRTVRTSAGLTQTKRTSAPDAAAVLDGAAKMPVFPASERADMPVRELAAISAGEAIPVEMNFRISMLPIDPVPMNTYRVIVPE
jgi:hypothetical protein